ncbi:phospholipase D family protein [Vibrio parahaemolyticus]|uniref:phospholipase D family protein n=1 Tax=Vibrio parahaemolyticus TaxID=670 RepID=UPI00211A6ECE|nr:phospholipase D family protein [Vibrio parahaemolyticus]MCQ9099803.1 hypothetical protein [Vibrio parahaemolyticus]MDG2603584.1 phospholipase D family protein [Vibrio parahaemolyticus]MDL2008880.1 phospholipase D family protein [Vibrio parahaemolyticus]
MGFTFQTPFEGSGSLIDSLNEGAKGAIAGGGVYAFASVSGIDSLFRQAEFINFLEEHSNVYHLIVGIDEITNSNSLVKLKELSEKYQNLRVNVFYHEESKLFHPKFTWFLKRNGEGTIIIGSGNLTNSGVLNNWEAYYSISQSQIEFKATLSSWNEFLVEHGSFLLDVYDEKVIMAAKKNDIRESKGKEVGKGTNAEVNKEKPKPSSGAKLKKNMNGNRNPVKIDISPSALSEEVEKSDVAFFVREAMTARERGDYSQILFSEEAYRDFFGFNIGDYISYDVYDINGFLGEVVNPSITVKESSNYSVGIASRKEGKSRGRADPIIRSNFMVDIYKINNTPPIFLIIKIGSSYKVVFSHPSNGLNNLHSKLREYLNGSREKVLNEQEKNVLIADFSLVSDMIK